MRENIIQSKSFLFAVRIVNLCKHLQAKKKEFILSKQLLRCGTSVGAMIKEAEHSESKKDFIHKLSIAQKEINETIFWLELLKETNYLSDEEFKCIHDDAIVIIKILTAILKTTKSELSNYGDSPETINN